MSQSAPESAMREALSPRLPGIARCLYEISAIKVRLRLGGFRPTLRYVASDLADCSPPPDPAAFADETARQVALAGALYPARARCLEQALTLCRLLRRRGIDAHVRLGVQPYRFRAHAWVEFRGVPINEPGDGISGLAVLPDIQL
jgi:hypothetical protein